MYNVRWNHTVDMVEAAVTNKVVWFRWFERGGNSEVLPIDWYYIDWILALLQPLKLFTLILSNREEPTSQSYTKFEPDNDFKILKWWKDNEQTFPNVSRMAKDFLAIPASSVPSESAMSTAGRVIDDYRSSLSPEIVKVLITGKSWIQSKVKYGWKN